MGHDKAICVDCMAAEGTVEVRAAYTFDMFGEPNGSKELVCEACAAKRKAARPPVCRYCGLDVAEHTRGSQLCPVQPGGFLRYYISEERRAS